VLATGAGAEGSSRPTSSFASIRTAAWRLKPSGLPPLTVAQFRVSATVSKVAGGWSQAVSLLVK